MHARGVDLGTRNGEAAVQVSTHVLRQGLETRFGVSRLPPRPPCVMDFGVLRNRLRELYLNVTPP